MNEMEGKLASTGGGRQIACPRGDAPGVMVEVGEGRVRYSSQFELTHESVWVCRSGSSQVSGHAQLQSQVP
jgi:hypothetical protein